MTESRESPGSASGSWSVAAAVLGAALLVPLVACEPDVGNDPVPAFMEFDTDTGRIPEPTIAAVSQTTGMLDFSALGYDVPEGPAACLDATGWSSIAECEFFQYLETLDGYPTLSSMRCPASAPLDLGSVTYDGADGDTLVVLENGVRKVTSGDGLAVTWGAEDSYLYIDNPSGWKVGVTYIAAVRGYDNGVVTTDGTRVVAPVVYSLLKREESLLDCTPDADSPPFYDPDAQVDDQCKYYELVHEMFASQFPDTPDGQVALDLTVKGLLVGLESLRQGYKGNDGFSGMWDLLGGAAGSMDKSEAAIAWAWPVHSQSTVELQPQLGMVPVPEGDSVLRLRYKGTIDASSLVPFSLGTAAEATVYLLNATVLEQALDNPGLIGDAILSFTPTVEGDEIVLTADAPFVDGDRHIVMLAAKAEGDNRPEDWCGLCDGPAAAPDSRPFVPSPLTVFLRTRGPLVDLDGNSLVSQMDGATAQEAEEGRQALAELFDNELWPTLTAGLIRENVVYVYAFDYVAP